MRTYRLHCAVCMDTFHNNTEKIQKKSVPSYFEKMRRIEKKEQTNVYLRVIQVKQKSENEIIKT